MEMRFHYCKYYIISESYFDFQVKVVTPCVTRLAVLAAVGGFGSWYHPAGMKPVGAEQKPCTGN